MACINTKDCMHSSLFGSIKRCACLHKEITDPELTRQGKRIGNDLHVLGVGVVLYSKSAREGKILKNDCSDRVCWYTKTWSKFAGQDKYASSSNCWHYVCFCWKVLSQCQPLSNHSITCSCITSISLHGRCETWIFLFYSVFLSNVFEFSSHCFACLCKSCVMLHDCGKIWC